MRVKRGVTTRARHKKIIKAAKGFRGKRKNVFKLAKNAVMKAGQNSYRDRRLKKRTFHQLWVLRINAACREHDLRYSRFIYGLELAGIEVNRKMLSEIAIKHPDAFKAVVDQAKAALPPEGQAPSLDDLKMRWGVKPAKGATPKKEEAKEEKAETSSEGESASGGKKPKAAPKKGKAEKSVEATADKKTKAKA
jgi:large subunit ribosomal protein L20